MQHSLMKQLKNRRLQLGLKQKDMMLRVGISRQQYQLLESKGNPRLNTLELIAKGFNCELLLIPQEKLNAVKAILENTPSQSSDRPKKRLSDDPWQGLLDDENE